MAEKVGVRPATVLLFVSRSVMVTVEVATPFAVMELVPVIVEFAATADPETNVTVDVTPVKPAGVAMLIVFVSAVVEAIVAVATPEALVVEPGWTSVLPVPVAANVVDKPETGLLFASRRVIVTVEVVAPSAVTPVEGEVLTEEFAASGGPATNPTVVVTPERPAGVAMLTVFTAAAVDLIVAVATPEASVTEPG